MMSWQMAEELAAEHMRQMGFLEVQRAADGPDGGVDVWGRGVAAQVKHWAVPVGIAEVQRLRGTLRSGSVIFYSQAGYTKAALEWASSNQVCLFTYDQANTVTPVNGAAEALLKSGQSEDFEVLKNLWLQVILKSRRCTIASVRITQAAIDFFTSTPGYLVGETATAYQDYMNQVRAYQDHLQAVQGPYAKAETPMPSDVMRDLLGMLHEWEQTIVDFWERPASEIMLDDNDFYYIDGEGLFLRDGVTEDKKTPQFSLQNPPPKLNLSSAAQSQTT